MSDKNIKLIRKQIRNVCQEMFGEVLSNELVSNVKTTLQKEAGERMGKLEEHVKETLTKIDERAKDVQGYIMREVASQMAAAKGITSTPDPEMEALRAQQAENEKKAAEASVTQTT